MAYNPQDPSPEISNPHEYAPLEDVRRFVNDTLLAFAEKGREFYSESLTEDPNYPSYETEVIPYDPALTPHLDPYDSGSMSASELSGTGVSSFISFAFITNVESPGGNRTISKFIELEEDGMISQTITDVTPTEDKAREWKEFMNMNPDNRRQLFKEMLGKMLIQQSINEMEGLPQVPEGITNGELEDLRKLLPVQK